MRWRIRQRQFPTGAIFSGTFAMRTRVKICGITNPADAQLAARAGADAIGLIFYPPSPRHVTLDVARGILAGLPPFVTPVALFVDASSETILHTCQALRLRHVQLHGHETPDQVAELSAFRVIKSIKVDRVRFAEEVAVWRRPLPNLCALLLETNSKQPGGTGQENDWAAIKEAQSRGALENLPPLVAAGGLHPSNVAEVVRGLRPWAVDVSTGTEQSPGKKSPEKISAFLRAVHSADATI
jgi:phosphoribosylanthranilate isomerase